MSLRTNIVAYYEFNNGAITTDTYGGFTLTNNGSTPTTASGKIGYGADFGTFNTTKYLTTSSNLGIAGNDEMTISAWVNLNSATFPAGNIMTIASHRSTLTVDRYISLFYAANGGTPQLRVGQGGLSTANYTVTLTAGTWYHVLATRDSSNYVLYLNGVQVATAAIGTNTSSQDGFAISNEVGSGNDVAQCSMIIDEVGIWNRKLTTAQIALLYNYGYGNQYPFYGPYPIAYDNSFIDNKTTSTSPYTASYTNNGNFMHVVVWYSGSANQVTSITYGGVSFSRLTSYTGNNGTTDIWTLEGPPTGSNTISVTFSGSTNMTMGAISHYRVKQTGQPESLATKSTIAPPSGAITQNVATLSKNDFAVAFCIWGIGSPTAQTAGSGAVLRSQSSRASYNLGIYDSGTFIPSPTNYSMTSNSGAGASFADFILTAIAPDTGSFIPQVIFI